MSVAQEQTYTLVGVSFISTRAEDATSSQISAIALPRNAEHFIISATLSGGRGYLALLLYFPWKL